MIVQKPGLIKFSGRIFSPLCVTAYFSSSFKKMVLSSEKAIIAFTLKKADGSTFNLSEMEIGKGKCIYVSQTLFCWKYFNFVIHHTKTL